MLKHLIHLVGDAHQPLHFDPYHIMGGNLCWVRYQGKAVNMHQLIDRLLLDQRHQSIDQMADAIDSINLEDASRSLDLHDWLTESKTALRQIYPVPIAKLPFYCKASQTQHLKIIHSEQIQQLQHHVDHQLALAGRRLAMILNAIYDPM